MTRSSQSSYMESMESLSRSRYSRLCGVSVQGNSLNILSDRPKNTKVTGAVLANNQPISSIYKSSVSFVKQDDILLDTMTARECLTFSANFRLKDTHGTRKARVEALLEELKLTGVADNHIGTVMKRGLSGENDAESRLQWR